MAYQIIGNGLLHILGKAIVENPNAVIFIKMVPRGGIEPPTQGFSVLCSTN